MSRKAVVGLAILACLFGACREKTIGERRPVTVLGCVTTLTGEGGTYGAATKRGVDLAVAEINANRPSGHPLIAVQYEDDKLDPTAGRAAFQKLASINHVPAVLGAFGSSVTLAIAPLADKDQVVLFSASSTADAIRDAGDYVFRNVPPNSRQGETAATFAATSLHARTAAVLSMNNDYGESLRASFVPAFEHQGGKVVAEETYNPGATDFRAQLTKLGSTKPDIVFYPGHYQESGLILRQAREQSIRSTFIGGDGSYSPDLIKIAGAAAEGSYYTLMAIADPSASKAAAQFLASFRKKYGQDPDVYAGYAYDGFKTLVAAADSSDYTGPAIRDALYKINFVGVTGVTRFDRFGEVDKPFAVYKVINGQFVRQ